MQSNQTPPIKEPHVAGHTQERGEDKPAQRNSYRQRTQKQGSEHRQFNPRSQYSNKDQNAEQGRDANAQSWKRQTSRRRSYSSVGSSSNRWQDDQSGDETGFRNQRWTGQQGAHRPNDSSGGRERPSYQHRDRSPRSGRDNNYGGNRRPQEGSRSSFKGRPSYRDRGPNRSDSGGRERPSYRDRGPRSGGDNNYGGNRRPQEGSRSSFKDRPSYRDRGPNRSDSGGRERPSYQHRDRGPRSGGDNNYGGNRRPQEGSRSSFKDRPSYRDRGPNRSDSGGRERPSYQHRDRGPRSGGDNNYGGNRRPQEGSRSSFKDRPSYRDRGPNRTDSGGRERPSYRDRGPNRSDSGGRERPSYRDRGPRSGGDNNYGGNRRPQEGSRSSFKDRPSYRDRGPNRSDSGGRERPSYQHRDRGPRSGGDNNYGGNRRPQEGSRSSFKDRPSYRDRGPNRTDSGDRDRRPDRESTKDLQEQQQVDNGKIPNIHSPDSNTDLGTDNVKVHKTIASSGLMSRRNAEEMIVQGRVSVAGNVVKLGERFPSDQTILVDGEAVAAVPTGEAQLLIYYKPRGEIVSSSGSLTVFENLPPLTIGRWVNIGRLDVDSEGLLLFTTDGDLANRFAHPQFGFEREYAVRAAAVIPTETMENTVVNGLTIAGEIVQPLRFTMRSFREAVNQWYEIVLNQGRNRVVRRLFEALEAPVNRLIRVRFGDYCLPQDLEPGDWRMVPLPKNLKEA